MIHTQLATVCQIDRLHINIAWDEMSEGGTPGLGTPPNYWYFENRAAVACAAPALHKFALSALYFGVYTEFGIVTRMV